MIYAANLAALPFTTAASIIQQMAAQLQTPAAPQQEEVEFDLEASIEESQV